MARVVLPFPVVPGKSADEVKTVAEEFKRRPEEYAESRRRLGVTLERAYLQTTPAGMFVVAYVEGDSDFGETFPALARSDLDIDKYFVRSLKEIHGVDVTQQPEGPPPETMAEWRDPQVTERRRGMAFTAPLIPGAEDVARSFFQDAYSRAEMTESRRALGQNLEVVTLVQTPQGPVGSVYLEGQDSWEANRRFHLTVRHLVQERVANHLPALCRLLAACARRRGGLRFRAPTGAHLIAGEGRVLVRTASGLVPW